MVVAVLLLLIFILAGSVVHERNQQKIETLAAQNRAREQRILDDESQVQEDQGRP